MDLNSILSWIMANGDWLSIFAITTIFTILTVKYYTKKDAVEKEPRLRLVWALFLGMLSTIPAIILSIIMLQFIPEELSSIVIAPVAEEIVKILFVMWLARAKSFDGPLDGLIYGAMVGAGFAYVENILYALQALGQSGIGSGILTASLRSAFQIIGHPFYTGIAGVGVGANKVGMRFRRLPRLLLAMIIHAIWNGMSLITELVFLGYLVLAVIAILVIRFETKRWLKLDQEAADRGYYRDKSSTNYTG